MNDAGRFFAEMLMEMGQILNQYKYDLEFREQQAGTAEKNYKAMNETAVKYQNEKFLLQKQVDSWKQRYEELEKQSDAQRVAIDDLKLTIKKLRKRKRNQS